MTVLRPLLTAVVLTLIAGVLLTWTILEARHQRQLFEEALTREASVLTASLGPGLVAASNAARELDELVIWKLLDNARLLARLFDSDPAALDQDPYLLETNGLDGLAVLAQDGFVTDTWGESLPANVINSVAPLLRGDAEELILGSTVFHDLEHLAAAIRRPGGGALVVSTEVSTARTFARRLGVENLLTSLVGTGRVLYLHYHEEPGPLDVEASWQDLPIPAHAGVDGLRIVEGKAVFEAAMPLEAPAGSEATIVVGLDGTPLQEAARDSMIRTMVMGLVLAALAIAGSAFAFVSHLRSRERSEAAKRLAEADLARRRSERLAAAGALTAGLAHEVRSPLNAIGLAAQRLERKLEPSDERHTLASRIRQEVRRLEAVLREFLDFANPTSDHRRPVQLDVLADEVIQLLETEAQEEGVVLEAAEGAATASVDREAIRRSLINLIRNAIQATATGGSVHTMLLQSNGEVRIIIDDQGPGLDPELAAHLFDPFVTGRATGTGLGLALVKRVAEEHGGSVTLENRRQGGARAELRLPQGDRK